MVGVIGRGKALVVVVMNIAVFIGLSSIFWNTFYASVIVSKRSAPKTYPLGYLRCLNVIWTSLQSDQVPASFEPVAWYYLG